MTSDKFKIRISAFVGRIIENDAQAFGFYKSDGTSNKNALLNKLIPQMLKKRQEYLYEVSKIDPMTDDLFAVKYAKATDDIKTRLFFGDEHGEILSDEIWIRPSKEALNDFEEIERNEIRVAQCDLTTYLRSLLNEYSHLPQYLRQSIVFKEESAKLYEALNKGRLLSFRYDGELLKVFPYYYEYAYLPDNNNYLLAYDIENQNIRAFALCKISHPKIYQRKYRPSSSLINDLQSFIEDYIYDDAIKIAHKETT